MNYKTFIEAWTAVVNDHSMYTKDGLNDFIQEHQDIIQLYLNHIPSVQSNGNPLETIDGVRALIHLSHSLVKRDNGMPHDLVIKLKPIIKQKDKDSGKEFEKDSGKESEKDSGKESEKDSVPGSDEKDTPHPPVKKEETSSSKKFTKSAKKPKKIVEKASSQDDSAKQELDKDKVEAEDQSNKLDQMEKNNQEGLEEAKQEAELKQEVEAEVLPKQELDSQDKDKDKDKDVEDNHESEETSTQDTKPSDSDDVMTQEHSDVVNQPAKKHIKIMSKQSPKKNPDNVVDLPPAKKHVKILSKQTPILKKNDSDSVNPAPAKKQIKILSKQAPHNNNTERVTPVVESKKSIPIIAKKTILKKIAKQ